MDVQVKTQPNEYPGNRVSGKRKKIGFLTLSDARNRRSWSGSVFFMAEALERHCGDVVYLGPLETRWAIIGKILNRLGGLILGKRYDYTRSAWYARRISSLAQQSIEKSELDYIVAPAAAPALAYLGKGSIPILSVSDTTFELVSNYYEGFSGYLPISVRDGHRLASLAMQRADIVSFASQWAADSAVKDYGIESAKVQVISFGANLDYIPPPEIALQRQRSGECRLLFLGVDWLRKGGDIAFETLLSLEADYGIKAHLTVCGCPVPEGVTHERLTSVGFLDKRDPQQAQELSQLFMETDYLLLPTRNECFGVVFCEASAYGVPSVSTDTGGVSGVISEKINGLLLPENARGDQYAREIAALESNDEKYRELAHSSRREYENRLNWDVWAREVGTYFEAKPQ